MVKTVQNIFGLSPYVGHAADATVVDLADFFTSLISGDANGDGKVDEGDYAAWFAHYLMSINGVINGDFDGNGLVQGIDYAIWLKNFGL